MKLIKKKWRLISLIYLLLSYIVLVVLLHKPLYLYFINVGIVLLLLILLFLGTFLGFMGLVGHMITKKETFGIPFYHLAYKLGTENPTILATYGLLLLREEKSEKALQCFQKGYDFSKNYMTTKTLMSNIAICYWKLGDTDQSIKQYYTIIKRFGNDDQIFLSEPDYSQDGVEQFAIDNHLMYPQDFITLGYLYLLKKDFQKANFFTQIAMYKQANYASAYDNLGQIAYFQGDLEGARINFEQALEFSPKLPDSLYFMGLVSMDSGDNKKALAFLEEAKACKLDGLNTINYSMIDEAIKKL